MKKINVDIIITIINLGFIGDIVNSSPLIATIKNKYPNSKIVYITIKDGLETAKNIPGVDVVYEYDKRGKDKGLFNLIKKAWLLRQKEDFQTVFLLNESFRTAFFAFCIGAKRIIGRKSQGREFFLTDKVAHTNEEKEMKVHVSEHYMRLLKPLGLYTSRYNSAFSYSNDDKYYIESMLKESQIGNTKIIGICPCTRKDYKDLDFNKVVKLINFLNKEDKYKVVIIGDKKTLSYANKLKQHNLSFIDFSDKTNIGQLAALCDKCEKIITADTGTAHIAYTLKVPTVTIFHHDIYNKWGPKDLTTNKIIYNPNNELTAEEVLQVFNEL